MRDLQAAETDAVAGGIVCNVINGETWCSTADRSWADAANAFVDAYNFLHSGGFSDRDSGGPGSPMGPSDVPGTGFAGA